MCHNKRKIHQDSFPFRTELHSGTKTGLVEEHSPWRPILFAGRSRGGKSLSEWRVVEKGGRRMQEGRNNERARAENTANMIHSQRVTNDNSCILNGRGSDLFCESVVARVPAPAPCHVDASTGTRLVSVPATMNKRAHGRFYRTGSAAGTLTSKENRCWLPKSTSHGVN